MSKVRKLNPVTGQKEWVDTKGSLERQGKSVADQFKVNYGTGKKPLKVTTPASVAQDEYEFVGADSKINKVSASSPEEAMKNAQGIAPTSGVMKVQQTTSSQRAETMRRQNDLDQRQKKRDEAMAGQTKTDTTTTTTDSDIKTKDDSAGDRDDIASRVKKIESEAETKVNDISKRLSAIAANFDSASNNLISSLQTKYGARIEAMKMSNKRLLETKRQIGLRTGAERYTPGLQAGVLADEEISGHERIAELEGTMLEAVARAQIAKADGKLKMFNEEYDKIESVYKSMQEQIIDLHKIAVEKEKEARLAEKAEADAEKAQFEAEVRKSKAVSTAVAGYLNNYKTEAEKNAFLEKYAEKIGVSADVLFGEVENARLTTAKKNLDIQNVQSTINKRGNTSTPKSTSFGTASDRTAVKEFLAAEEGATPAEIQANIKKANESEEYFYKILNISKLES